MKTHLKITSFICSTLFVLQAHAASFGEVAINDPVLGNKTITYEKKGDYAVIEGDIILSKLKRQGAIITRKVTGTRWSHGIIPFAVDEHMPLINKIAVFKAVDYLQKHTNLEFIEINSSNQQLYSDSIRFVPAEGTTCSSYVGRQGGVQVINLAPRCTAMNTVHELGHAIGMWHEQSRADRNAYIMINWENIEDQYKDNFLQHLADGKDFGEYDYQSIMHYGPYAFSKNGQQTIIPLLEGIQIGLRDQLSEKDIAAINAMYPQT